MTAGQTIDPVALARELGLEPHGSGPEVRMRCPNGCDESHKRSDFGASMATRGDKAGVWCCFRCEGAGNLEREAERDGAAAPRIERRPVEPPADPIEMPAAWDALSAAGRERMRGHRRRWALDRGWPEEVADAVAELPDVAVAIESTGHRGADRLSRHALDKGRPTLFALRDSAGVVRSVMRRASGQVSDGTPKTMAAWSGLIPWPEGVPKILGSLPAWVEAAREGSVVMLVEGEPDFAAAAALAALGHVGAAIGAFSARGLVEVARAAKAALVAVGCTGARVLIVPHLGDTVVAGHLVGAGQRQSSIAAAILAARGSEAEPGARCLVSQLHLPTDRRGKVDLSDYLTRAGLDELRREVAECSPFEVGSGRACYSFGGRLRQVLDDGGLEIGAECWPVALTESVEGDGHGVRYRYRTPSGATRYGLLSSGAWATGASGGLAAQEALIAGVQIAPGQGGAWVAALGTWAHAAARSEASPREASVTRPGWHGGVYVNGERIHGANWRWTGSPRAWWSGSAVGWRAGVEQLGALAQPALALALGWSLSGPLIEGLGRPSTMLHLSGASSTGKTTATLLGLSVWAPPGQMRKWSNTANAAENALIAFNSACIVMDEIGRMRPEEAADFIHRFASGQGKERSERSGELNRSVRHWRLAALSSGEVSAAAHLGSLYQGGHAVRCLDVVIHPGEGTRDAAHAEAIERLVAAEHGEAGSAWVDHLVSLDDAGWAALRKRDEALCAWCRAEAKGGAEDGRIARALAVALVALEEAEAAGIIPHLPGGVEAVGRWALGRLVESRRDEGRTPEERAWEALRRAYEAQPGRFPSEDKWRQEGRGGAGVIGVAEVNQAGHLTGAVFTTSGMLREWRDLVSLAGSPSRLLDWAVAHGHTARPGAASRVGGHPARWWKLALLGSERVDEPGV